jgi:hypothetical protein
MRKNPIFLVMLVVMLASSLVFIGCPDDDENKKKKGSGKDWPAEFLWDESALTGEKTGTWSPNGKNSTNINFYNSSEDKLGKSPASVNFSKMGSTLNGKQIFYIDSIKDQTITVKQKEGGATVVLCTSYTLVGEVLTLIGGNTAGFAAALADEPVADVPAAVLGAAGEGVALQQRK